jgi:hypothetical protein
MTHIHLPKPPEQRFHLPVGVSSMKAEQLFTLTPVTNQISGDKYGHVIFALGSTPEEVEAAEAHVLRQLEASNTRIVFVNDDLDEKTAATEAFGDSAVVQRSYNESLEPWYDGTPDPYGRVIRMSADVIVLDKAGLKAMYYPWSALEYHITVIGVQIPEVSKLTATDLSSLDQQANLFFSNPYLSYLLPMLSNVQATVVLAHSGEPQTYSLHSKLDFFKRTEPTAGEPRLSVVDGKIKVKKLLPTSQGSEPVKTVDTFTFKPSSQEITGYEAGRLVLALGSTPEEVEAAQAHVFRQLANSEYTVFAVVVTEGMDNVAEMEDAIGKSKFTIRDYPDFALTSWYATVHRMKPDVVMLDKASQKTMAYPWQDFFNRTTVIGLQVADVHQYANPDTSLLHPIPDVLLNDPRFTPLLSAIPGLSTTIVLADGDGFKQHDLGFEVITLTYTIKDPVEYIPSGN